MSTSHKNCMREGEFGIFKEVLFSLCLLSEMYEEIRTQLLRRFCPD
jgi:hypothetical protein